MAPVLRSYDPQDFSALYRLDQACFPAGISYSCGESQKSGHKKESYQRNSEGNGKSITKTFDSGYFLAIATQHGANEGHNQTRNDGTKQ